MAKWYNLYKSINEYLRLIDKKIIVFIDDLDRLDKDELLEVIKLIRNTANFYNTFFLVAYDRSYVLKAIENHNPYNHHQFLEKIFQLEINLPYFNTSIFRDKLVERLCSKFPKNYWGEIEIAIKGDAVHTSNINDWIHNLRDVTRLANSVSLNFNMLKGEVVLSEFIQLELLRLKFPAVYELLFRETKWFLETKQNTLQKYAYILKIKNKDSHSNSNTKNSLTALEEHLNINHNNFSVSQSQIDKIINLLNQIFGNSAGVSLRGKGYLSIVYPSNFNRYFAYSLLQDDLSEIEFSNARKQDIVLFKEKIKKWVEFGLEQRLVERFTEIKDYDDNEDFEKIIKAIFYLCNQPSKSKFRYSRLVDYDNKDLMDKVWDYKDSISKFYDPPNGRDMLKKFILDQFYEAKIPFDFESDVIKYWLRYYPEGFLFEQKELEIIAIKYFSEYAHQTDKIDWKFWGLFHSCKVMEWVSKGNGSREGFERFLNEGKEVFIKFVKEKDLDGFICDIIEVEAFKETSFAVSQIVQQIFDSWDNFDKFLQSQDKSKWKYLSEFEEFFIKFKGGEFKNYVPFEFKIIPIKDKIKKRH